MGPGYDTRSHDRRGWELCWTQSKHDVAGPQCTHLRPLTVLGPALSLEAARAVSGWAVLVQHSDRGTLRLRAPPLLRALVSSAAWVCARASAAGQPAAVLLSPDLDPSPSWPGWQDRRDCGSVEPESSRAGT